jgi:hypothetical protein
MQCAKWTGFKFRFLSLRSSLRITLLLTIPDFLQGVPALHSGQLMPWELTNQGIEGGHGFFVKSQPGPKQELNTVVPTL